ncbi:hypothetical protein [Actinosynnema sp. NPDC023587]|uniref:hypothetical protein n=1 Tax=Actinosynnema sp. NPDC023587 TaxID=3154695 RepID=UPI003401BAA2
MTTTRVRDDDLLRFALKLDGLGSAAMGVLMILVDAPLGLPRALVIGLGLFLVVNGAAFFALGVKPVRPLVGAAVVLNFVWVVDSFLTAFAGWFPVTTLGMVVIVVQAVVVVGCIALQVVGLRRAA